MHDSFTPMGGLVPLFNMHLGEVVFGGVGAGLYGMLVFVVIAIFIAGLMVGRTPGIPGQEDRGVRREAGIAGRPDHCLCRAGFRRLRAVTAWGNASLNNSGPHGFSEILYAYSSATGNNGSAFAGLNANVPLVRHRDWDSSSWSAASS